MVTITDYLFEKRDRGITIQSALVSIEWDNGSEAIYLNLLDTPGLGVKQKRPLDL